MWVAGAAQDRRTAHKYLTCFVCACAWLILACKAEAQTSEAPSVVYVDGQLRIDASNVTLAELLSRVTALTGVKFDVPVEATVDRLPIVKLGPGPAREILAALLNGSHLNYLIQEADGDPQKIQAVLIMAPEKKGKPGEPILQAAGTGAMRPPQLSTKVEQPPAPISAPPAVEAAPSAQSPSAQSPTELPDQAPTALASAAAPGTLNGARVGALTPPPVLSPQSISQQLQQMYQQRMQMNQQSQAALSTGPSKL